MLTDEERLFLEIVLQDHAIYLRQFGDEKDLTYLGVDRGFELIRSIQSKLNLKVLNEEPT